MFITTTFKQNYLPLRLTKLLYITYNDQNTIFGKIPNQWKFIKPTWTKIIWPKTKKWHRKSSQNEKNKTMETPNLQTIPTKYHDHTHQGVKNTFNMLPISHSEEKITQKYTNSIPIKSNNKFHNYYILQQNNQVTQYLEIK